MKTTTTTTTTTCMPFFSSFHFFIFILPANLHHCFDTLIDFNSFLSGGDGDGNTYLAGLLFSGWMCFLLHSSFWFFFQIATALMGSL